MTLRERLYTVEEFWEIARLPENEDRRLELEDGVIVEMAGSRPINTVITGRIVHFFNEFVIPRDLGYVTVPDGSFKLAPKRARQPDVAVVLKSTSPVLPNEFRFAPDLAVEVVSPDEDVLRKVRDYIRAGTQIVWAVYPDELEVYVFTPSAQQAYRILILDVNDTLDGGDVLPGFTLSVRDIFPPETIPSV
jgi:Uma2 family endonuclease